MFTSPKKITIDSFDQRLELAKWMVDYSEINSLVIDSIRANSDADKEKAGDDWFCTRRDSGDRVNAIWDAYYGKFENGHYSMAYHYTANIYSKITRVYTEPDSAMANSYARALINSRKLIPDSVGLPFRAYIQKNGDKKLSVWLMPTYDFKNKYVAAGCDFYYSFDEKGNNVLERQINIQPVLRAFSLDQPKAEIWLDYKNYDEPPLGAIYYAWRYKFYFKAVYIATRKSTSVVYRNAVYTWFWKHYAVTK